MNQTEQPIRIVNITGKSSIEIYQYKKAWQEFGYKVIKNGNEYHIFDRSNKEHCIDNKE